ncbi:hypothetical protein KIN20_016599 [Parelaphostrongylus tenuis]|uniref:Uncharacterized protein n=1 Tax=Parelaphostrongylus tenuis TaxID=148309 RepID=A0AAD5MGP7_PARTN|nr:hypothetical protein KIN20_016599 [Parelaphostrongylus tenuis]
MCLRNPCGDIGGIVVARGLAKREVHIQLFPGTANFMNNIFLTNVTRVRLSRNCTSNTESYDMLQSLPTLAMVTVPLCSKIPTATVVFPIKIRLRIDQPCAEGTIVADEHVNHVADGRDHPDAAGGAYTKEAEEADRESDDHSVDREAARGQEDYDRAAGEKSSDPGSDALFHRATLGDNL